MSSLGAASPTPAATPDDGLLLCNTLHRLACGLHVAAAVRNQASFVVLNLLPVECAPPLRFVLLLLVHALSAQTLKEGRRAPSRAPGRHHAILHTSSLLSWPSACATYAPLSSTAHEVGPPSGFDNSFLATAFSYRFSPCPLPLRLVFTSW